MWAFVTQSRPRSNSHGSRCTVACTSAICPGKQTEGIHWKMKSNKSPRLITCDWRVCWASARNLLLAAGTHREMNFGERVQSSSCRHFLTGSYGSECVCLDADSRGSPRPFSLCAQHKIRMFAQHNEQWFRHTPLQPPLIQDIFILSTLCDCVCNEINFFVRWLYF